MQDDGAGEPGRHADHGARRHLGVGPELHAAAPPVEAVVHAGIAVRPSIEAEAAAPDPPRELSAAASAGAAANSGRIASEGELLAGSVRAPALLTAPSRCPTASRNRDDAPVAMVLKALEASGAIWSNALAAWAASSWLSRPRAVFRFPVALPCAWSNARATAVPAAPLATDS